MNRRKYQIIWIVLVVVFGAVCSETHIWAQENTTTKKGLEFVEDDTEDGVNWIDIFGDETTTEETETESSTTNPGWVEIPTEPKTTGEEEVTTRRQAEAVTKDTSKGNKDSSATVSDAVTKTVMTIVKLSKAGKKKAKIYVFAQGKYKTKKTKITVTIQVKKAGKWKTYKVIKKNKNSFYCTIKKKFRITKKQSYRAYVKIYYYNKKKKKIGSYKKKTKVLRT
ncbi:MAG: hypothetical protein K6G85_06665 [Eubacterium sp.]|nr:hypothetical protein [Eubacterium sp.]